MVKWKSKLPWEKKCITIPSTVMELIKDGITLSIDVIHVNKVPFLISKAYHLKYYQCILIRKKNRTKVVEALLEMRNEYKQWRVFKVRSRWRF